MTGDNKLPSSPKMLLINTKYIVGKDCYLEWGQYSNERKSLRLVHDLTGETVMTVTVNIPEADVPPGHILVKNWSENDGIVQCLEKHKIIEAIRQVPVNFVYADLCRLLVEVPQ